MSKTQWGEELTGEHPNYIAIARVTKEECGDLGFIFDDERFNLELRVFDDGRFVTARYRYLPIDVSIGLTMDRKTHLAENRASLYEVLLKLARHVGLADKPAGGESFAAPPVPHCATCKDKGWVDMPAPLRARKPCPDCSPEAMEKRWQEKT